MEPTRGDQRDPLPSRHRDTTSNTSTTTARLESTENAAGWSSPAAETSTAPPQHPASAPQPQAGSGAGSSSQTRTQTGSGSSGDAVTTGSGSSSNDEAAPRPLEDPSAPPIPIIAERFKTKMCKNFETTGQCQYGARCMFAHGARELRTTEQNMADGITTQIAVYALRRRLNKAAKQPPPSEPTSATTSATVPVSGPPSSQPPTSGANGSVQPALLASTANWHQLYHHHHAYPTSAVPPMPPAMAPPPTTGVPFLTPPTAPPPAFAPAVPYHHYHTHHALAPTWGNAPGTLGGLLPPLPPPPGLLPAALPLQQPAFGVPPPQPPAAERQAPR